MKGPISFSTARRFLVRARPAMFLPPFCSGLTTRHVFVVSANTELELPLPITLSSYVLWHLRQGCFLSAPRRTAHTCFASGMSEQYKGISGKHSWVSELPNGTSSPLSAAGLSGFKTDDIAFSGFDVLFCTSHQEVGSMQSSRSRKSERASPYKENLSCTSRCPCCTPSSAIAVGRNRKKVYL